MPEDQPVVVTGGSLNIKVKLTPGQTQPVEISLPDGGRLKSVQIDEQTPIQVSQTSTIKIITEV